MAGHHAVVQELLSHGADVQSADTNVSILGSFWKENKSLCLLTNHNGSLLMQQPGAAKLLHFAYVYAQFMPLPGF